MFSTNVKCMSPQTICVKPKLNLCPLVLKYFGNISGDVAWTVSQMSYDSIHTTFHS